MMLSISCDKDDDDSIVKDIDGNVYHTVTIGTQVWMVENLKVTRYNDGTPISNVTDNYEWKELTTGAYCNYVNDESNGNTYGRLYNWYAIETGKLCPTGWHVPSDEEWTELANHLGGDSIAGGKLKEAGTVHWSEPNTGATNSSGFSALPGGHRDYGEFFGISYNTLFWSSTEYDSKHMWYRSIWHIDKDLNRSYFGFKGYGFSVRCIKD